MPEVAALVPMRAHSERVPGKNLRPLGQGGKPLFHYVLATLSEAESIGSIWIDTDSPEIAEGASKEFGAHVIERPQHLRGDMVSMNDILLHDITIVDADLYLQTHSTNPFLKAETIDRAVEAFLSPGDHDSLFSVTRCYERYWTAEGRPVNHDPERLIRTQDLPPFYRENSCIYIFTAELLRRRGTRIGERPILFEIASEEALDIDEHWDFRLAELIIEAQKRH